MRSIDFVHEHHVLFSFMFPALMVFHAGSFSARWHRTETDRRHTGVDSYFIYSVIRNNEEEVNPVFQLQGFSVFYDYFVPSSLSFCLWPVSVLSASVSRSRPTFQVSIQWTYIRSSTWLCHWFLLWQEVSLGAAPLSLRPLPVGHDDLVLVRLVAQIKEKTNLISDPHLMLNETSGPHSDIPPLFGPAETNTVIIRDREREQVTVGQLGDV